jgi:hypothetical protein
MQITAKNETVFPFAPAHFSPSPQKLREGLMIHYDLFAFSLFTCNCELIGKRQTIKIMNLNQRGVLF